MQWSLPTTDTIDWQLPVDKQFGETCQNVCWRLDCDPCDEPPVPRCVFAASLLSCDVSEKSAGSQWRRRPKGWAGALPSSVDSRRPTEGSRQTTSTNCWTLTRWMTPLSAKPCTR